MSKQDNWLSIQNECILWITKLVRTLLLARKYACKVSRPDQSAFTYVPLNTAKKSLKSKVTHSCEDQFKNTLKEYLERKCDLFPAKYLNEPCHTSLRVLSKKLEEVLNDQKREAYEKQCSRTVDQRQILEETVKQANQLLAEILEITFKTDEARLKVFRYYIDSAKEVNANLKKQAEKKVQEARDEAEQAVTEATAQKMQCLEQKAASLLIEISERQDVYLKHQHANEALVADKCRLEAEKEALETLNQELNLQMQHIALEKEEVISKLSHEVQRLSSLLEESKTQQQQDSDALKAQMVLQQQAQLTGMDRLQQKFQERETNLDESWKQVLAGVENKHRVELKRAESNFRIQIERSRSELKVLKDNCEIKVKSLNGAFGSNSMREGIEPSRSGRLQDDQQCSSSTLSYTSSFLKQRGVFKKR